MRYLSIFGAVQACGTRCALQSAFCYHVVQETLSHRPTSGSRPMDPMDMDPILVRFFLSRSIPAGTYSLVVMGVCSALRITARAGLEPGLTNCLVISLTTNLSGHIFAGTIAIYPDISSRVFRSTDDGASWNDVGLGDTCYVKSFVINSKGYVFAGTYYRGMFRSTDNGDSWRQINAGLTDTQAVALAINSHGHLFVGTTYYGGGVFRSTDSGESWSRTGLRASYYCSCR